MKTLAYVLIVNGQIMARVVVAEGHSISKEQIDMAIKMWPKRIDTPNHCYHLDMDTPFTDKDKECLVFSLVDDVIKGLGYVDDKLNTASAALITY